MVHTLDTVAHQHHDALVPHVDALAEIANAIGSLTPTELTERLAVEHRFITNQLLPHLEQAEQTLYPALERLLQNRHSMTPLRREHEQLRQMFGELGALRERHMEFGVQLRLRRILFRMYALLKIHLAEEEAYLVVLERNLSPEEEEALARGMAHALADPPA